MKKRKPNLERLYMMHSLKEALKIARQALADPVSYASVLPRAARAKLERAFRDVGDLHMSIHDIISKEHSALNDSGHTELPKAAR